MENTHIPGIQPSLDRRSIPQEFTTVSMTFDEMIRRMTGSCKSKDRGDGIQKRRKNEEETD